MANVSLYERTRARLVAGWRNRAISFKAIAFAFVGVVNTAVDYCIFLIARALLDRSPTVAFFSRSFRLLPVRQRPDHCFDRGEHDVVDRRRQRFLCHEFNVHLCRGIGA